MADVVIASAHISGSYIEEIIAFLIVAAIIWRKLWPLLNSAMNKKAAQIGEQLAAGEQARKAVEELVASRRQELEAAKDEAVEIVEQAKRSASQTEADGMRRAGEEERRIVARASVEIDQQLARARDEVVIEVSKLVVDAARFVIDAELDSGLHHQLISQAIRAAESEASDA